jgi:hypothetical protein
MGGEMSRKQGANFAWEGIIWALDDVGILFARRDFADARTKCRPFGL